jgi:hypothetical protein
MGRFSFWLGLTGLILGAIFGAIDLETLGGIVGGAVGCFVGALVGEVIDLLIAPFFGGKEANTVGKWVGRILGLAFLVVFCHELFWMTNFVSLAATHNIGARITRMITRNDSRQAVQDTLKDKRWQVALFAVRPTRWFLLSDIHDSAQKTQDLVDDVIAGRTPVDTALHARGTEVAQHTDRLLDRHYPRTWLLHYLPRDVLIPKE